MTDTFTAPDMQVLFHEEDILRQKLKANGGITFNFKSNINNLTALRHDVCTIHITDSSKVDLKTLGRYKEIGAILFRRIDINWKTNESI